MSNLILIDRNRIATMVPHAGTMCLLDGVLKWNETSVRCISWCYQNKDNPMRRTDGTLGSACGIELAAQAMAVHSRLVAGPGARTAIGYLLSVRDVWLGCRLLDATPGDLVIDASRQMGDGNGATYCFKLARAGSTLLSGRITVMLRSKVKE